MLDVPPVPAHWYFPARLASVGRARRAVAGELPRQLPSAVNDDLGLLTSELVTNAIQHGSRNQDDLVELVLWRADGHYWLAVSDYGTDCRLPTIRRPGEDDETGRGLVLVDQLAAAWTVRSSLLRGTSVVAGLPAHTSS